MTKYVSQMKKEICFDVPEPITPPPKKAVGVILSRATHQFNSFGGICELFLGQVSLVVSIFG